MNNKRNILKSIFILSMGLLFTFLIVLTNNKFSTFETLLQQENNNEYDFNGDGITDTVKIISHNNSIDYKITCLNQDYYLSHLLHDNLLFSENSHLKPNLFICDLSRDKIPEIILMGSKNKKNVIYICYFVNNSPKLYEVDNKNILGMLDLKNSHTPQINLINSKDGISSNKTLMLINNNLVDVTVKNRTLPGFENILEYIKLVELPYVIEDLPDIFTDDIDSSNLSLLWSLNKDKSSYAFQNALFYDYEYNELGEPTLMRCCLSFEKSFIKESKSQNMEFNIILTIEKCENTYKINNMTFNK